MENNKRIRNKTTQIGNNKQEETEYDIRNNIKENKQLNKWKWGINGKNNNNKIKK